MGDLNITTISCDTSANVCAVPVKAPEFALVFLDDSAVESSGATATVETFSTTALTKTINTVTIDASALASSNGMNAKMRQLGSTSKGSASSATIGYSPSRLWIVVSMLFGLVGLVLLS
jgi:hypothetical protein